MFVAGTSAEPGKLNRSEHLRSGVPVDGKILNDNPRRLDKLWTIFRNITVSAPLRNLIRQFHSGN